VRRATRTSRARRRDEDVQGQASAEPDGLSGCPAARRRAAPRDPVVPGRGPVRAGSAGVRAGHRDQQVQGDREARTESLLSRQRRARHLGISKYKETEKRVPNLCYPANDARAIRAYFESVRLTAYSGKEELLRSLRQVEVKDLVDEQATKQGMLDTFADMLERTTHQDTVILVFSGHGVRGPVIEDPLYLIPHDGEFTGNWWRFHQRNLALSELLRPFRLSVWKGGARRLLMIIDTCYSGAALVEKELDARVGAEVAIIASALPYQKAKDSPDGRCLLQPYGDRDRGFFAKILLGALRGRGDGPAVEEAGGVKAISMYGLMDHVRRGMMKETQDQRPMGIGRFQGWLLPVIP